ncbi:J domain-containing protein [Nannocystaceae bacterium ST9]
MTSHYRTLGVAPNASSEQIKAAWRLLSLAQHPDRHPGDPRAGERYRKIREARDCLLDPVARAAHDAELTPHPLESMFSAILLGEWVRQTQVA